MNVDRLNQQMEFIIEIDKMKQILRKSRIVGGLRYENDAEHTWHLAVMAVVFREYAAGGSVDLHKVIKMLLIHDLVEIDAGDTFAYDDVGYLDKAEREGQAAKRIFGLLPEDAGRELSALWHEFETRDTAEARYANALDRLQPMLLNCENRGQSWRENNVSSVQVRKRATWIEDGAPELASYIEDRINEMVENGYLSDNGEALPKAGAIRRLAAGEEPPYELLLSADPSRESVNRSLESGHVYVMELDGGIAGVYILTDTEGQEAEILNLAVKTGFQRQGIGRTLLLSALDQAKSRGCSVIHIATGNSSLGPLQLYQRLGFRITAVDPDYFTRNYSEPIVENSIVCRDRLILSLEL